MRRTTAKVAVSVPTDLFRAGEGVRKRTGQSRSAVLREALRQWLANHPHAEEVRAYREGYRRRPEGRRETVATIAAALGAFADEGAW